MSSRVKLDLGEEIANKLLGKSSRSGLELINRVLVEPHIMWKRFFFIELRELAQDQQDIVLQWFTQMTHLQKVYINEIEKANDYLKSLVSKSYDSLSTSERFKQEFIAKVSHIENRQYFHRKRKALNIGGELDSKVEDRGRSKSPHERLNPGRLRGLSGVRLPHNMKKHLAQEKSFPV